ncbi:hypothetical protein SDJN02_02522, partial [Cucurbita argyrosperma subsp. argyrosperma]
MEGYSFFEVSQSSETRRDWVSSLYKKLKVRMLKDDELADSEGEMDSNVLYRATATTGRKFRMVVIEMRISN